MIRSIGAIAIGIAAALGPIASQTPAEAKPAEPTSTPATSQEDSAVHSYILLDRTGSMSSIWDEALSSVNAYAASVAEEEDGGFDTLDTQVTVAVFDAQEGLQFDLLRKGVNADAWTPVSQSEAHPRGMTPLFDAIGRMVAVAEADAPDKAVIVIMTDGHENASREITKDGAKAALDRVRAKGWDVVFLGAEFARFDDAGAVGVSASKSMAIGSGQLSTSMERLAKQSRAYGKGEQAEVIFDEEDRAAAGEEAVKQRKGQ
ncbi:MAG: vWA domain-containing protein [Pseudomonadota bacterium]